MSEHEQMMALLREISADQKRIIELQRQNISILVAATGIVPMDWETREWVVRARTAMETATKH